MENRKQLAIILSRFPYPLDKGDKLRAYHQLKYLAQFFDIHLFALTEIEIQSAHYNEVKRFCKSSQVYKINVVEKVSNATLSFAKAYPVQVGYFYSNRILKSIHKEIYLLKPDLIYGQLSRTALYFNTLPFKKLIDFQDAFSVNYHRIQAHSTGIKKWFYKREGKLMQRFEQKMLQWFDACTIISMFDKEQLIDKSSKLHIISNGVDATYFSPKSNMPKQHDILFLGNLSYLPNQQAAIYLIEKIAPLVQKILPNIRFHLAGAEPGDLVNYKSEFVHVSGWIEDIREAYMSATIFVAPLFTGAGLQNKLLEAMCMQLPCITTPIANASLNAIHQQHLLVAADEQDFTNQIIHLLQNETLRNELAINAKQFVETNYSWESANEKLKTLFDFILNER